MRRPWPTGGGGCCAQKKKKFHTEKKVIKFSKLAVFEVLGVVVLKIRILVF